MCDCIAQFESLLRMDNTTAGKDLDVYDMSMTELYQTFYEEVDDFGLPKAQHIKRGQIVLVCLFFFFFFFFFFCSFALA